MNKFKRFIITALVIVLCIGTFTVTSSAAQYGSYFDSVLQFAHGMYYKDFVDKEALIAVLKGLFGSFDKYSGFFTPEEARANDEVLNGNFVGIGAGLEEYEGFVKVIKIYSGSPAEKAGLMEGDIITAVDGKSIENMDAASVATLIRGEENTVVTLTIKREGAIKEFSISRGKVKIESVQFRTEDDIIYIKIESFSVGTAKEFRAAMDNADKNDIFKVILDLRGNTGGYVDEAINVARRILPKGIVTTLDYKSDEFQDSVFYSDGSHRDYVVAVLTDENTASASEIVAGAIEDSGIGILIGQKTFGKGIFQQTFSILTPEAYEKYSNIYGADYVSTIQWSGYFGIPVSQDEILGVVRLTTGYYTTPKGRIIHGIGLIPAIELPNSTHPNGVDLALLSPLSNTEDLRLQIYNKEVYNAEGVLKALGYLKSTPDMSFGQETVDAVKKYQTDNGLKVTGIIDTQTRDHLNKSLITLRNANDKPYVKAQEVLGIFKNYNPQKRR
ncbi:MAG: PDZ domain-containing protein [Clostridiaceae bacterium]|nr:PDZ domain-containing protein [Clostridiaceae bacterium]